MTARGGAEELPMDKGAHFRNCDFQVHTPRDINWNGDRPVSEDEREAYAHDFVKACRDKGVGAVAISDHHDMEFVDYIRTAAANEQDENGEPVPSEARLVVFPAMELTLVQPCQAIIIFDSDFPSNLFPVVYASLALHPTSKANSQTAEVQQLNFTLKQLHDTLDGNVALRGRYIVLPNITDGGHQTLMRAHFQGHYSKMPCVGGYSDKALTTFGEGHQKILDGRVQAWGSKKLGLFQTSDSRHRDHNKVGALTTWVKWAEPTAEALRQACLARESRLSQVEPALPHSIITQISVSNSKFLGNFVLEFNPQYNAIIGGRGTGKSTILEYLRWALCDEPHIPDDPEAADFQNKRQKLIERTLVDTNGQVEVRYLKNGVLHVLRRSAKDKKLTLKIADGEFESATEEQIRSILPVQAYSQKQLSSVGVRVDQLQRFIEAPVKGEMEALERQRLAIEGQLREQFARFVRKRRRTAEEGRLRRELASVRAQIDAFRKRLTGLTDDDRALLNAKPTADAETVAARRLGEDLVAVGDVLATAVDKLRALPRTLPETSGKFSDIAVTVHGLVRDSVEQVSNDLQKVAEKVDSELIKSEKLSSLLKDWETKRHDFDAKYEAAKERSSAHEGVLKQLSDLEHAGADLASQIEQVEKEISDLGKPDELFPEQLANWRKTFANEAEILAAQCNKLTELSGGRIRATLRRNANLDKPQSQLQASLKGSNVRTQKVEELFATTAGAADPLDSWASVCDDLLSLAFTDKPLEDSQRLPATKNLTQWFGAQDLIRIANKINPDEWIDVALGQIRSKPRFEYMTKEGEYIPFEEASAGQQATALLGALLNQDGIPLIIDQPEDDLDSQVIVDVVSQIWKSKHGRQLVFSSHNANLVVNGDAELVACCDYLVAGEQSKGKIKLEGAIDVKAIREEIAKVMEGGKEAFRLRGEKYGF